jgi:pyridoxamine 5'-phosphate oxidase-like protein
MVLSAAEFSALGRNVSEANMTWLPQPVVELIDAALVTELSVVRSDGRVITYPLIPMWDGDKIVMTSSILFSRKLEHIKRNGRVALSFSDPVALGGRTDRATIQGDATVIDGDPHTDWERTLPLWSAKEPVILQFLKARVAFPLFFERSVIEVVPTRALYWPGGDTSNAPQVTVAPVATGTAA